MSGFKRLVTAPGKDDWSTPGSDICEETELYDLQADSYELNKLIGLDSHDMVVTRLRERLKKRMHEAFEAVPVIVAAPLHKGQCQGVLLPAGSRILSDVLR